MYSIILISKVQNKLSSNIYFENLFDGNDIDWTAIYMLTRLATYNAYTRSFQYKFFHKVLFRNKKLHIFEIKSSPSYSFGNLRDKTPLHIFYKCEHIKCLWSDLNSLVLGIMPRFKEFFQNSSQGLIPFFTKILCKYFEFFLCNVSVYTF